jgi:hypothetical protein
MAKSKPKKPPTDEGYRAFEREVVAALLAAQICAGRYGPNVGEVSPIVQHDVEMGRQVAQAAWAALAAKR